MRLLFFMCFFFLSGMIMTQIKTNTDTVFFDSSSHRKLNEIIVSASRISELILKSPVGVVQLSHRDAVNFASASTYDALENLKGIQMITPSIGFKVINSRGFTNTTNVRFSQLIDGIDNQAPHIGAPIANALGANELDIEKTEIIQGTASALYGLNAINGLANIITKNPFTYQGLGIQQLTGVNHVGNIDKVSPQLYSTTNLRYANALNSKFAFKITGSYTKAYDWLADNHSDLASTVNASTNLSGLENPAYDEVNGYGNEASNRKILSLQGKQYSVARTGYREIDIADYTIKNYKSDFALFFRPKKNQELSFTYKNAFINTLYQRSNRFRLEDYLLQQFSLNFHSDVIQIQSFYTLENTGKSYNLRSLAENMDRSFKSDDEWFKEYTSHFNDAYNSGLTVSEAHQKARINSDNGRFEPGTDAYNQKKDELTTINNWDYGAALRVKSRLFHSEGLLNWDKLFPEIFKKNGTQLLTGFDYRTYIIIPDGNYFINPVDSEKNLTYAKSGGFIQLNKDLFNKKLRLGATVRAAKSDYFNWKFNPRVTVVYAPKEAINFRASYQRGYRFPSIFEGFSNVNSGGVKRVGGLKIMSDGVFENSYTKASIDAFQAQVLHDMNALGLTQIQAIENNKGMLKKNPYTYLQPEFVRSTEFGFRGLTMKKSLFIDVDFYYNAYDNFIAQVEASIPNTTNSDSIPTYLYAKSKQSRYRLWTNSKSKIYNYGASLGLKYRYNDKFSFIGNITYSKLDRTKDKDGLEDGFNTPSINLNGTILTENIWKKLGASITGRYQTKFNYDSFLVSGEVPSFYSFDCQLNYYFEKRKIRFKVAATNLLNKYYYSILGGSNIGGLYYTSIQINLP